MTIGNTYAEIVNSEDGACNKIEFINQLLVYKYKRLMYQNHFFYQ